MSHIFISYSRKDLDSAEKIVNALAKDNLETWIDWKNIPPGEQFTIEIEHGIEGSDVFLFLISPDSVKSDWCEKEIIIAINNGKRIIPILIRNTEIKEIKELKELSIPISNINWIACRGGLDDFDTAIKKIQTAIHTDYKWLRYHTKLQVKSLDWERRKDDSRLLRGKEFQEAEQQLASIGSKKDPRPTDLQRQFVLESRKAEQSRRRTTTRIIIGVSLALCLFCVLAVTGGSVAYLQSNAKSTAQVQAATAQIQADEQGNIALSRKIASAALTETGEMDVKLILCAQAFQLSPTAEAKKCINELMDKVSHVVAIRRDHTNKINDLAVNISGSVLASASDDGSILIGDTKTWGVIKKLETNHEPVTSVMFSPDGKTLVSGDKKGTIFFWDVENYELKLSLELSSAEISSLAFRGDGEVLAVGTGDTWAYDNVGEIILIDTKTNQMINQISQGVSVTDIAYNPKNQDLAFSLQSSPKVNVLNVAGELSSLFQAYDWNTILSLAFSPDGNTLVTGSEIPGSASAGGYIVVWDTESKEAYWNLEDYSVPNPFLINGDNVKNVEITGNNQYIINTAGSGIVIHENTKDLQKIKNFTSLSIETTALTESLVILPDNNTVVVGMSDGKLVVWSIIPSKERFKELLSAEQQSVQSFISQVSFSPDTENLVAFGEVSGITYWDINSNTQITTNVVETPKDSDGTWDTSDGTLSPDGKLYAFSPYYNSEIVILNIETKEKYSIPSIQNPHLTFANGTMLLAYKDNDVQVCNLIERQCKTVIDNMGDVKESQLSSGGSLLALGISDGSVILWDVKQSKSLASFSGSWAASDLIFSPNENLLVWGDGNVIKILDIQSNNLSELLAHSDIVEKLVFSPDGQYLASSAFRDRVILWDINSQTIIGEMPVNPYWVGSMAFSPNSNKLIIPLTMAPKFGGDSSLLVWDIQNFVSPTTICEIVGRNLTQQEWQQYFPSESYIATCPQWAFGQ